MTWSIALTLAQGTAPAPLTVGSLLLLAISAAVINNFVLSYFLGICPFLGVSKRIDMALGMGLAVTFVMTMAATVTFLFKAYVLMPLNIEFLQYVMFIFVIAALVQLVEMYLRKFVPKLYDAFGIYLPLITTNCAILGVCIWLWDKEIVQMVASPGANIARMLVYSIFAGLGFTLAIVIMAGIREELDLADVPRPLRGAPITLLTAAILALAFSGFVGIGG